MMWEAGWNQEHTCYRQRDSYRHEIFFQQGSMNSGDDLLPKAVVVDEFISVDGL
jgi:hypothetical protein